MVTLRCCEIIVKHQQMNESSVGASFVPCLVALEEARENLKETEYGKYIFDQEMLMDDGLTENHCKAGWK